MQKAGEINIRRISAIKEEEMEEIFAIIKSNMENLGYIVSQEDKEQWCKNILNNLYNKDFYLYLVRSNREILGFVEIIKTGNSYVVSEVQLSEKAKATKIILKTIKFLLYCEELSGVDEVCFSVLKNNTASNKTFSHLGGEITSQSENKYRYVINRKNVEKYLSKFKGRL